MSNSVRLEGEKAAQCANDLERVLNIIPELERLSKFKVKAISPGTEKAMERLGKLRDHLRGR
jgi:hypothetical protein